MSDFPAPIVFVSNAGLNYGLPTNRQHLPRRLAEYTPVLYAAPFSLTQAMMGQVSLSEYRSGVHAIGHNLFQHQYLQLMPMVRGERMLFKRVDELLARMSLRRQVARLGMGGAILWLYYPPSFRYLIGRLGESVSVYHCTDDHAGFAETIGRDSRRVAEQEIELLQAVDVVFATSRPLYEAKLPLNPNTYLMPNVADVSQYRRVASGEARPMNELAELRRPIAGFIGAVSSYKVDFQLLSRVALTLNDWNFVLVGPVGLGDGTRGDELPRVDNLHFVGARPHSQLPDYLAAFDVCLIPYNINAYTRGVFPLKLWEYLAAGKPVVATPLPALAEYGAEIILAATPGEFAAAIQTAYKRDNPEAAKQRSALATRQSWEQRAEDMLTVLTNYL